MSKSSKSNYYEDKSDVIVGIIALVIIAMMFVWMIVAANNGSRYVGKIVTAEEVRRGRATTLEYKTNRPMKKGETVTWFVDGQQVGRYVVGSENTVEYTPVNCGTHVLEARIGKSFKKTVQMNVLPPKLDVIAQDETITYGDELPEFCCDAQGFLDCDEPCNDWTCACTDAEGKIAVGTYSIDVCGDCKYKDYEVESHSATLTVLPKAVSACEVYKTYDKTDKCQTMFKLCGVIEGDDVVAVCDFAKFADKNAGEQTIVATNVRLEGRDASNYVLEGEIVGKILPKPLSVVGISAKNKAYDGTTKATLNSLGTLVGVLPGDNVAIGGMEARFDDSEPGARSIGIEATLVGADKNNYVLKDFVLPDAEIFEPSEQ